MKKILPCPKCGEDDDIVLGCYDTMRYSYTYVQCNQCLHIVESLGDEDDAIDEWNEQTTMGE